MDNNLKTTMIGKITHLRVTGYRNTYGNTTSILLVHDITLDNKQFVRIYSENHLNINLYDTIEVTGSFLRDILESTWCKLIKKYIPIQKRIGDFEK
jgi:hypothetical protein